MYFLQHMFDGSLLLLFRNIAYYVGLGHVLSWPKLGLEPTFHDPGTFGDLVTIRKILVHLHIQRVSYNSVNII